MTPTAPAARVAGWNLAGCLPESDPVEFGDFRSALDYLIDELVRRLDYFDFRTLTDEEIETGYAITELRRAVGLGIPLSVPVGHRVYWLDLAE
jgi:hypothetical protein